jgi:hypothetical protein
VHDLCELAARYVALEREIQEVRRGMLSALTNGAGAAVLVRPTRAGNQPGAKRTAVMEQAAQAERQIADLLREQPRRMAEIASSMGAPQNTTGERLRRMRERGLIERDGQGGAWRLATAAG